MGPQAWIQTRGLVDSWTWQIQEEISGTFFSGRGWKESGNFPRVTVCDLDVRVLGNIQRHTVQCVLVINIFIEKIFIFLWMWYTLLTITTIISLFDWLGSAVIRSRRYEFVSRNLEIADVEFDRDTYKDELEKFVREWIKIDGVFVLRMITIHNGTMFTMELIQTMWLQFQKEKRQARRKSTFISNLGYTVVRDLEGVVEKGKEAKSKHSDDEDDHEENDSATPRRPAIDRSRSVFVPLLLDHSDKSYLPYLDRKPEKKFGRSVSTFGY